MFFFQKFKGYLPTRIYRNNLKNREFDKKASQNSHLEKATIVRAQGASEDENFEKKPTPSKTDSSGCFGIPAKSLGWGDKSNDGNDITIGTIRSNLRLWRFSASRKFFLSFISFYRFHR